MQYSDRASRVEFAVSIAIDSKGYFGRRGRLEGPLGGLYLKGSSKFIVRPIMWPKLWARGLASLRRHGGRLGVVDGATQCGSHQAQCPRRRRRRRLTRHCPDFYRPRRIYLHIQFHSFFFLSSLLLLALSSPLTAHAPSRHPHILHFHFPAASIPRRRGFASPGFFKEVLED